jgi:hypothetical protein
MVGGDHVFLDKNSDVVIKFIDDRIRKNVN